MVKVTIAAKRRWKNDITLNWLLTKADGSAYDLDGHELRLWMVNRMSTVEIDDFSVSGNLITWVFGATLQKPGDWYAVLEDDTGGERRTIDVVNAITLVEHTYQEEDGKGSEVGTDTVSLQSEIAEALRGYSAYEIAVRQGYEGTEEEWVKSLSQASEDAAAQALSAASEANSAAQAATAARDRATKLLDAIEAAEFKDGDLIIETE